MAEAEAEAVGVARAQGAAANRPKRKGAPEPAAVPARAAAAPARASSPPAPQPAPQRQQAPPALSPGQLVCISGLSQRAELNGRTATVVQWEAGNLRRYTVELAAPFTNSEGKLVRKLKLHPANVAASPS